MDDSEITAAIAAADPAGLLAAYDRYAASLYGYCRRILGEPAPAAGALLRTFEAAAAGLGALTDSGEVRAWLYAAARAECLREMRTMGMSVDSHADDAAGDAVSGFESGDDHGTPDLSPLDTLPAELREQLLLRSAVSTASPSAEGLVGRARSIGRAGFHRLGTLVGWSRIRANVGTATVVAAVAVWAVAAISAALIAVIGTHTARAVANQPHRGVPAAAPPRSGGPASPSTMASPAQSPEPASSPTRAGVAPPAARNPSPAQSTGPAPAPSPSARPSPSPKPSPSPSPSSSSPSPSPSPSSS